MSTPAAKAERPKTPAPADRSAARQGNSHATAAFVDDRPAAAAQRQQQALIHTSPRLRRAADRQALIAQSPRQQAAQLQAALAPVQRQETPAPVRRNSTGLPDELKAGVENLSGYSLDDVQVHYNSDKPAQLQAHAYAQGTDIHVAPGQEQHLPHEAWHVVQQKQGRVKPTMLLKGKVGVNNDAGLEKEADTMGAKALQKKVAKKAVDANKVANTNKIEIATVQRKLSEGENADSSLVKIITSLQALRAQAEMQADGETLKEVVRCIEKATEVLNGGDADAKAALVESANTGANPAGDAERGTDASPGVQLQAAGSAPVQRVISLAIAAAGIGYVIYRIWQNHQRVARTAPEAGQMQDIPTTRAAYGETLAGGGLTTRERNNQEIGQEVRNRTAHNHNVLYQQLIEDGNVTDIARLINGIRDDDGLCIGTLCHDLTRFLIQQRTKDRPTIEALKEITGATVIAYNLNSGDALEDFLRGCLPGTSVYLGSDEAMSGHTFTVIGENRGRVIVADRQPANPVAALKYASAVEAEARLGRNLNPDKEGDIDREFSGKLVLNRL